MTRPQEIDWLYHGPAVAAPGPVAAFPIRVAPENRDAKLVEA